MKAWIFIAFLALSSCKADKTKLTPDGEEDASVAEFLSPPVLNEVPERTPNATVAIRGTSGGKRIVVQGGSGGTTITSILPGGNFCSDIELGSGDPSTLTIYAMGEGLLSASSQVVVTRDATAPVPPSPTCSGASPEECDGPESCDNELDDDCDGWVDICDLDCSDCSDDSLEPNDFAVDVPIVEAGDYDLALCPCREDWFAFIRETGQSITATASFSHAAMNLNMRLYRVTASGEQGDFLVGSFSVTNQESIDFAVDADSLYFLRVYAFGNEGESSGTYQLTIN